MIYRFAEARLDTARHLLEVAGETVAVEPQVFEVIRTLAEAGGDLVSTDDLIAGVWQGRIVSESAIAARISAARAALGDNGRAQAVIRTVPRRGFRLLPEVRPEDAAAPAPAPPPQEVRFAGAPDGASIAWTRTGTGPPLLAAGHWLTHLEHDWQSPIWRPQLEALGRHFAVTRYDQRGNGLSDHDPPAFTLQACVGDMGAVADAAGLDRFPIYAKSQGVPIAIAYAVMNPARVSHLVLLGGFALGRARRDADEGEAMLTMIRAGWGRPDSPFVEAFSALFLPDGTQEELASLAELQRRTVSAENAVRLRRMADDFDVRDLLARVEAPTLVAHARGDGVQPVSEGRRLAAGIPGARFLELDSRNHVMRPSDPAWPVFLSAMRAHLQG
jgi:DNA-binding winged helix-turn-helix (wHTH) protein